MGPPFLCPAYLQAGLKSSKSNGVSQQWGANTEGLWWKKKDFWGMQRNDENTI